MTKTATTNWLVKEWKLLDPDKTVTTPAKYRRNDNRNPKTKRHNSHVLFMRG